MNKSIKSILVSLVVLTGLSLASCNNQNASKKEATYKDMTSSSEYGKISDFNLQNGSLKEGDELKFKVTPSEDFSISSVTVNGKNATDIGNNYYSYTLEAGLNRIVASYSIDKSIDFVSKFKLQISDEMFTKVMSTPKNAQASDNYLDFRKDGIELINFGNMMSNDGFINYVDGDTTHVETLNYGYTVKIRYLGIDTPESTSEIEKWGKAASNYNKSIFESAKYVILEGQGVALTNNYTPATADSNQRSLAYVWYATKDNPVKEDFRCLNLEMVYQGFSQGIGSKEDMGNYFYSYFDKATKSAQANLRHIYSNDVDETYYDYKKYPVQELTLKKLYETTTDALGTNSIFANTKNQTLYKVRGYVSRKLDSAFYIQDKPSYTRNADGSLPEAYGIYVFTYASTPIKVGDEVEIIGTVSTYGGSYQLQGISYHNINPDYSRDTRIVSSNHKIEPLEVTYEDFNSESFSKNKLNNILIKFKEDLYCFDNTNSYGSLSEGGVQEINKYNEKYPFYNTNNKIIAYAKYGNNETSNKKIVRFVSSEDMLFTYNTEVARSYKFFTGGTNVYNPDGAEFVSTNSNNKNISTTYQAKILKGVVGISSFYVSTSGATTMYSLNLVAKADVNFDIAK